MDTAGDAVVQDEVVRSGRAPRIDMAACSGATDADTDARVDWETSDPEDDFVRVRVAWFVNGKRVPGESTPVLPAGYFDSGDKVHAQLTASDGLHEVTRDCTGQTIGNLAPVINMRGMSIGAIDGLEVKGSDPDGDPLTWSIENAPSGMSISQQGVLSWSGESSDAGSYRPRVIAEDPTGDQAIWEFSVEVEEGRETERMLRSEARRKGLLEGQSVE